MSDFLKKFKSVFILEDSGEPVEKRVESKTSPTPPPETPGQVNQQFEKALAHAMERGNPAGFDYFEYRQALANLDSMGVDEKVRYQSAYAAARTMGLTKEKLLASVDYYLKVISDEAALFEAAHCNQRDQLVGSREKEISQLKAQIADKEMLLQQVETEIAGYQARINQLSAEIESNLKKIEQTKTEFETTYQSVVGHMQVDKQTIEKHLTEQV
jgi:hypothetical protein